MIGHASHEPSNLRVRSDGGPVNAEGDGPPDLNRWAGYSAYLPSRDNLLRLGGIAVVVLAEAYQPTSRFVASMIVWQLAREPLLQAYEEYVRKPERRQIYLEKDGLNEQFQKQKPTDKQISLINHYINAVFEELTTDGIDLQGKKFHMTSGRDLVSFDDFELAKAGEWCAISQSGGHFALVTIETANDLIQRGSGHLISREALQISDCIRGKALLDLFAKP